MFVWLSWGSYGVHNLTVGKENQSVCKAAARRPCDSHANLQDCCKAAAKKLQNILATRKISTAAG